MRDARRWQRYLPEAFSFDLEGEIVSPEMMIFMVWERVKSFIPRAVQRWCRLHLHARAVGKAARILRQVFEEVTFRPHHTGAKRSRQNFYALCAP